MAMNRLQREALQVRRVSLRQDWKEGQQVCQVCQASMYRQASSGHQSSVDRHASVDHQSSVGRQSSLDHWFRVALAERVLDLEAEALEEV